MLLCVGDAHFYIKNLNMQIRHMQISPFAYIRKMKQIKKYVELYVFKVCHYSNWFNNICNSLIKNMKITKIWFPWKPPSYWSKIKLKPLVWYEKYVKLSSAMNCDIWILNYNLRTHDINYKLKFRIFRTISMRNMQISYMQMR